MAIEFDSGPPAAWATLFSKLPDYSPFKEHFWFDWGPIFYRGRLDGTAKVMCIASDPGPTERIAGRTLVGDAGQRVQGFLAKLGITRSYLCLNAFAYALFPTHGAQAGVVLNDPDQLKWRNKVYDKAKGANVQVIIAFGEQAQDAVALWPGKGTLPLFKVPHPSSHDPATLLNKWRKAVTDLRAIVTPDPGGQANLPNYGNAFAENDYAAIPRRDLPYGVPAFLGDDAWVRKTGHASSVTRPSPDDRHTLIWKAPQS
jgi:uracil-DNA glycosylase